MEWFNDTNFNGYAHFPDISNSSSAEIKEQDIGLTRVPLDDDSFDMTFSSLAHITGTTFSTGEISCADPPPCPDSFWSGNSNDNRNGNDAAEAENGNLNLNQDGDFSKFVNQSGDNDHNDDYEDGNFDFYAL